MSDHQVFHEFLVDAVVFVRIILFEVFYQFFKHLFQHNKLDFID